MIGSYGIIKGITARLTFTAGSSTSHGAIKLAGRIPARAVITEVSCAVEDLSSRTNHNLELILSTDATKSDGAVLTTTGITAPVVLGDDAAVTYAQDSVTAMGTSNHIAAGSGAVLKTVYYNKPTTTVGHASSDMYLWVADGGSNDGASADNVIVQVHCSYIAID